MNGWTYPRKEDGSEKCPALNMLSSPPYSLGLTYPITEDVFDFSEQEIGYSTQQVGSSFCALDQIFVSQTFESNHPVARGESSDVYKGFLGVPSEHCLDMPSVYNHSLHQLPNCASRLVAIKVIRPMGSDPGRIRKCLGRYAEKVGYLDHKNIVPFYGVNESHYSPATISPWYKNGDADKYLSEHPNADVMQIIHDTADGLKFLHENGTVHGNLKATNILIDDLGHARLSNFGLSMALESEVGLTASTPFIARWYAPELLLSDAPSTKSSDVYSFASTVLEMLTGKVPYNTLVDRVVLLNVVKGVSPRYLSGDFYYDIPRSDEIWGLLEKCWAESRLRPSILEVRLELEGLDTDA